MMRLTKSDCYDFYRIFLQFRMRPTDPTNDEIVRILQDFVTDPKNKNSVRQALAQLQTLNKEQYPWVWEEPEKPEAMLKDSLAYDVFTEIFAEFQVCIARKNPQRFYNLADAVHNIPRILTEAQANCKQQIRQEIQSYRKAWNTVFLCNQVGNEMPQQTKIILKRPFDFRASMIPFPIFVNGIYIGHLKAGRTLRADVPANDCYLITTDELFCENALIQTETHTVEIKVCVSGGFKEPAKLSFWQEKQLPAFDYEPYWNTSFHLKDAEGLTDDQRSLILCILFWHQWTDDDHEILFEPFFNDILLTFREIGADRFAGLFEELQQELFPNKIFPLVDNDDPEQEKQLVQVYDFIMKRNVEAMENELRKCIADLTLTVARS